jgi:DNA-binding CsgD family transcriptional regulator
VYDELLLFDARRTHRRILAALESLGSELQHLEELAYHAWEARDPEKALRYNERAADTAFALQALPEARLGYERALELATERRDRARLLERLCRVTALLGDLPQAISLYETACPAALEIGDFDAAARLTRWTVGDRNNSGDASALAFGLAFLERWGERVSTGARDELLALLARLCTIEHELERATRLLEQIAEPQALPPPALQNVLAVRFDTAWYMGDIGAWTIVAEQWLALLPSLEPFSALIACYSIAQGASYHARDDLVARALAFADRIEARSDYGSLGSYGAAIRALDLFARGKLGEARAKIRTALAQPNIHVATAALALVAPFVADALDDDELITPQIDAEFALVRAHVRHVDEAAVLGAGAFWSLRNGRRAGAVTDLRRALDAIARPIVQIAPVLSLAAQHLPVGELGRLDRFCELAAGGTDESVGRAHAFALAAIIAQRRGDDAAATALGVSAAERFGRLDRPLLAAQAYETAGDVAAARTLYARCGAVASLKRLGEPAAANGTRAESLSDRQREVARLVAAGLNNVEIGERLAISTKTVEKHIASIYDKLGVRTRPQVALLVSGSAAQPAQRLIVDSA